MEVKPRALFVVAHAPNRFARQAGQKTAQLYLNEIQEKYQVDTIVLCGAVADEIETAARCESMLRMHAFGRFRKLMGILAGALWGVPPRFATRLSRRVAQEIENLVRERQYQLVWLEFSQVAWLLPIVLRAGAGNVKTVLSLHDIQSELVQRKSKAERIVFGRWTRIYERKLLRLAGFVRVQSNKDKVLVEHLGGSEVRADVAPPAMSDFVYSVKRQEGQIKPYSLLFWGAMNRTENYSAALRFARQILPRVTLRFPETIFFVVGANPPAQLRGIASDQIIVTGFVEDPTPYFAQAALGVVPLIEGAGIKVKTLEMLAAGLRVISTPIGAEGITPSQELIVTEIEGMADAIIGVWSKGN
jgi:glycosyltransferase involved in cell wall biosynthesis